MIDELAKHYNPKEVEEIVKHFVTKNRELMWQMLEGSPKSTTDMKVEGVKIKFTKEQIELAKQILGRHNTGTTNDTTLIESTATETKGDGLGAGEQNQ